MKLIYISNFNVSMEVKEHIVLSPKGKTDNSTTLWIERKVNKDVTPGDRVHVAGGDHKGIVIHKETKEDKEIISPAHLSLEFRVYLVNGQTGMHTEEVRTLRFWFRDVFHSESERAAVAQEFFRCLIQPKEFPRNYVGFIKKIMKLLQHGFQGIIRIELVLCQLEASELPERAPSTEDSSSEVLVGLSEEKVVEVVEHYFPNPITVNDLSREYGWDEEEVQDVVNRLEEKRIIKSMEHGGYTRVTQGDTDMKVVKQMPRMVKDRQPTIAIITAQFTEKLAFDAMIENKETFVRYTTVGESNIYTLGNIGKHRIVCTKLPSVGHTREAMTAAGNATTRLLGTFQDVDHVFLVGVAGGVPHFTDYNKHVRLGDVVISHASPHSDICPPCGPRLRDCLRDCGREHEGGGAEPMTSVRGSGIIYVNCEGATETTLDVFQFEAKEYRPKVPTLQHVAAQLKVESRLGGAEPVWKYIEEGLRYLESDTEHDFQRPPPDSDKLYMALGERDLIEVTHPAPQGDDLSREERRGRLHLGVIGAGREVARSDHLRQKFSQEHHVSAFVSEFDPVIESIIGNCRDSFIFVRGISDYKDGTKKSEWQPYAALAAASVTKAIISALDPMKT